ncbi:hypothetical protein COO91_01769 [Nostoc flagelliforme CCNUN1]|uniref:Uncharacterized protein n=1 Tax=Nostoc flagelliforme CCNUN1 TaxID=2038116 RepID=A0A2K8SK62_9NOSO|nr:hypothetical protein COO91_01769 [Nostoc flagelliforme CCNUN1]
MKNAAKDKKVLFAKLPVLFVKANWIFIFKFIQSIQLFIKT